MQSRKWWKLRECKLLRRKTDLEKIQDALEDKEKELKELRAHSNLIDEENAAESAEITNFVRCKEKV